MYKVQTLNNIAKIGLEQLPTQQYEIASEITNPEAILVRSQVMHEMSFNKELLVVGRAGAGTNNIPIASLTEMGIPVLNTPGANANAVKELVIAGMLLVARNIHTAWQYVQGLEGDDESLHHEVEKNKKRFSGFELRGKTLGVIGMGKIGVKVANAAIALGMKVIGFDPSITTSNAWQVSSSVEQAYTIESLLSAADFVSIHVPLVEATKNLLNAARLSLLQPNAVLLNFARDGIVDNQALQAALEAKKVFAYVSDFPNNALKGLANVVQLPHLGASTVEAEDNCARMIARQVRDYLENGNIQNSVNFPETFMPRSEGAHRIAIVNRNVPDMVAQISKILSKAELNIVDLLNKSRNAIAYSLIDVNTQVSDTVLAELVAIEGVLKVRRIAH